LGEHQLDKLGVTGSSPVPPTRKPPLARGFSFLRTSTAAQLEEFGQRWRVGPRDRRHLVLEMNPKPPRRVRVERGIYRNPSTGRLEIEYTDETGRVRWKTIGGSLIQARLARSKAQGERRSFAEVAEEWLAGQTQRLRPRTLEGYAAALDRHLFPRIGGRAIVAIDEEAIVRIVAELEARGLAGWTIRGILVPLGRVLAYATRRKLIPYNPMRNVERSERPRVARREMRILRTDEIDALLRAAPRPYLPLLTTAIFTGLRQSELLGLLWADIDFESAVLHVRRQLDRNGSYGKLKSPSALRTVLLSPSLAAHLRAHQRGAVHSDSTSPVFATATGRPMDHRNVTRRGLAVAIADADVNRAFEPTLRFHDLRHTYAAMLIAQGLNVVYVSRQLGHAYASFTLDSYGGLFDRVEHGLRATEALEAAFPRMLREHRHGV
jgi:integrase